MVNSSGRLLRSCPWKAYLPIFSTNSRTSEPSFQLGLLLLAHLINFTHSTRQTRNKAAFQHLGAQALRVSMRSNVSAIACRACQRS
jgi:hypothetical protein